MWGIRMPGTKLILGVVGGKTLNTIPEEMAKTYKAELENLKQEIKKADENVIRLLTEYEEEKRRWVALIRYGESLERKIRVFEGTATEKELP